MNDLDLYDTFKAIKERPAIYLGTLSIFQLEGFYFGYSFARHSLNLPRTEQETEFGGFQEWLQKRFEIKTTQSWAKIIFFFSRDEKDALDRFFKLVEEFIAYRRRSL